MVSIGSENWSKSKNLSHMREQSLTLRYRTQKPVSPVIPSSSRTPRIALSRRRRGFESSWDCQLPEPVYRLSPPIFPREYSPAFAASLINLVCRGVYGLREISVSQTTGMAPFRQVTAISSFQQPGVGFACSCCAGRRSAEVRILVCGIRGEFPDAST